VDARDDGEAMKDDAKGPKQQRGRISVIVPSLNRGGTETQLLAVLPRLVRQGFDIGIITLAGPGVLAESFRTQGIKVESLLGGGKAGNSLPRLVIGLLGLPALTRKLHAEKPDIVHTFLPLAGIVGGLAARISGCHRLITSRRNRNFYQRRYPIAGAIERFVNRRAQVATANSRQVAEDLKREGVPPERVALLYNGVDTQSAEADGSAIRRELGIPPQCLVMVVVANLIAYKGHADLLDALASAAPRMDTDWRLLLVGRDDGMGEGLKMQAERSGLSGNVVFCGEQAGVAPYLAAADVAILPSHEEGFSNSVLEGMAAGLAMVVTDVGGNAEAVIDGQSGLVVPPHSPDRLAAAIVELARDPVLRERYGEAARLRIVERFDLNRAAENLGMLYSALLEARPMPSALAFQPG